jgi:hypothetical protein
VEAGENRASTSALADDGVISWYFFRCYCRLTHAALGEILDLEFPNQMMAVPDVVTPLEGIVFRADVSWSSAHPLEILDGSPESEGGDAYRCRSPSWGHHFLEQMLEVESRGGLVCIYRVN